VDNFSLILVSGQKNGVSSAYSTNKSLNSRSTTLISSKRGLGEEDLEISGVLGILEEGVAYCEGEGEEVKKLSKSIKVYSCWWSTIFTNCFQCLKLTLPTLFHPAKVRLVFSSSSFFGWVGFDGLPLGGV
jgi:hypothetical protein